jgi:hypothetical protein
VDGAATLPELELQIPDAADVDGIAPPIGMPPPS